MIAEKAWDRLGEALRGYFRIHVEGLEHVPRQGPVVVSANHSGYSGADAIMIAHQLHHDLKRPTRILAHKAFFDAFSLVGHLAESFGLVRASHDDALRALRSQELMLIFPEAESGNFKPTSERYRLRPFHSGFVRLALETGATLVPCLVVGAEESFINLGNVDAAALFPGLRLPLPLNVVPLPAQWKIRYLPPIDLSGLCAADACDHARMHELSEQLRQRFQAELDRELERREWIYIKPE